MDSGSPPRHVQWGSYVDEEEVEYEEEGEGEEEEEENDGFVGESEGYEEEEEVCVEGDDEFDEEESEVLEMEEQEQEQEQEQETGKAEEAGQTSRPVGQFSFLSRKLSVWDTSKYISKWKLAHILQYHLKTFCNDETHRKFVAQQERDCKSSVPLPIVCMMEKEALSILEKTERTYRSRFGANHQLTKDVQERISALRTRLAARYGSAPPCAASAWQSFLLDWFPWLSTWLRKLQHYRYLAQKKKRERKKKWRMQVGGGENVDGAPDVPLEDEEEEEEEENDGMMDSMKGWVVDTVRRVSVYSGLIPDDEEEKDPDAAAAKTEERRGWRQWMGDVLKRASDAVVGQQPHGQGEHLADGTEEPRGWRQWMGGLLKRASDAVEGSKRGGEDDNKLKKPAEKPEGEGEKLQLPTQGQGEEPPHVDVQETEEGQPRQSGWNQQLRNMVSSTLPTNIGTHQAEWSQRVRNTIRRLSDGASATHEHETIPSEQLPGEEEQQQQQQQRQPGWGQRLRNMVQLPGGRASVTPEDEMIPMDQLQGDSEGQQQQQQQRQQPSRPRWEQRLAALRGQRATPQEGDRESDDQEEPGDNQVPPQPSQSQQQHHDV